MQVPGSLATTTHNNYMGVANLPDNNINRYGIAIRE